MNLIGWFAVYCGDELVALFNSEIEANNYVRTAQANLWIEVIR